MKMSARNRQFIASAILLGRVFHSCPALAAGCSVPSFGAARTFDVGSEGRPFSVAVGDFNGDGKTDLAVANYCYACSPPMGGSVSVLAGNGDGTFQSWVNVVAGPN